MRICRSCCAARFPDLTPRWAEQFALLFHDLRQKCDSGEISTKALDLRGLLAALRLMRGGHPHGAGPGAGHHQQGLRAL